MVFQYAGTASLERELKPVKVSDLSIGDVLINGGHPGHTVIIVDEAVNDRGEKVFLPAQGYTPAQEIEIFDQWFHIAPSANGLDTPGRYFRGNYTKRFWKAKGSTAHAPLLHPSHAGRKP